MWTEQQLAERKDHYCKIRISYDKNIGGDFYTPSTYKNVYDTRFFRCNEEKFEKVLDSEAYRSLTDNDAKLTFVLRDLARSFFHVLDFIVEGAMYASKNGQKETVWIFPEVQQAIELFDRIIETELVRGQGPEKIKISSCSAAREFRCNRESLAQRAVKTLLLHWLLPVGVKCPHCHKLPTIYLDKTLGLKTTKRIVIDTIPPEKMDVEQLQGKVRLIIAEIGDDGTCLDSRPTTPAYFEKKHFLDCTNLQLVRDLVKEEGIKNILSFALFSDPATSSFMPPINYNAFPLPKIWENMTLSRTEDGIEMIAGESASIGVDRHRGKLTFSCDNYTKKETLTFNLEPDYSPYALDSAVYSLMSSHRTEEAPVAAPEPEPVPEPSPEPEAAPEPVPAPANEPDVVLGHSALDIAKEAALSAMLSILVASCVRNIGARLAVSSGGSVALRGLLTTPGGEKILSLMVFSALSSLLRQATLLPDDWSLILIETLHRASVDAFKDIEAKILDQALHHLTSDATAIDLAAKMISEYPDFMPSGIHPNAEETSETTERSSHGN